MGVVLFAIYTGYMPFKVAHSTDKRYKCIMYSDYDEFWASFKAYKGKNPLSVEFKSLI
jgi:hypothetical protein